MMKTASLAVLILLPGVSLEAADNLAQLTPDTVVTNLLGGRLTVRLPRGAKTEPMAYGIMSAPAAESEETRVVLDAGRQRMVIMTYELFCLAGDDVEKRISEQLPRDHLKAALKPLPVPLPLKAYGYLPQSPTRNEEVNLVMGVYIIRSDSTMEQMDVYVNPAGARKSAKVFKLAEAICATVREGKKPMNTQGGVREIGALSPERAALITVPDGYVTTLQPGPDFVVYHVRKLVRFGEPAMSIGVYFGMAPSRPDGYSRKENTELFGRAVDWYEKITKTAGATSVDDDALVSMPPWFADVFLRAGDVAGMQELKNVAATLRFGEPQNTEDGRRCLALERPISQSTK